MIITAEDEQPLPIIHPPVKKSLNSTNEALKLLCHMDIDTEQLLHLSISPQEETGLFRSYTLHDDAEKTCLHQSASYLATDEDERRCDDLPVFDKCVFHLVGERSAEEKKVSEREQGRGRESQRGKV